MHVTSLVFPGRQLAATLVIAAVVAMSGCAVAGKDAPPSALDTPDAAAPPAGSASPADSGHFAHLPADSQFQRFIVKYRADTAPGRDPAMARERLAGMQSPSGVQLEWLRRLGVDADVIRADRPLEREEAAALMDRFTADPDVEYIEVDGILTIRTGLDVPPVKPLRE